ncbi:unnamed protein product [Moneuplotes crassus]|uniref:Uncharacterized protein n=1 Tax=Euplotes crassus TaxID=5936 RepID=A0AAD1XNA6_EUPCR|nr:unnamed protein product [Moneuplotes crassus]
MNGFIQDKITSDRQGPPAHPQADAGMDEESKDPLVAFSELKYSTTASIVFSDLCERHGERLIAYDVYSGNLICNRCIYQIDNPKYEFTSTVARNIASKVFEGSTKVTAALQKLQEIESTKVIKRLQKAVQDFLEEILQELYQFMLKCKLFMTDAESEDKLYLDSIESDMERSQKIRDHIFEQVKRAHFAGIVKKSDVLDKEIEKMMQISVRLDDTLKFGEQSKKYIEDKFDKDYEAIDMAVGQINSLEIMEALKVYFQPEPQAQEQQKELLHEKKSGAEEVKVNTIEAAENTCEYMPESKESDIQMSN